MDGTTFSAMKRSALGILVGLAVVACGPDYETKPIKTPDEIIAEEVAKADGDGEEDYSDVGGGMDAAEEKKKFDKRQSEIELKRAARSAATCRGVVTEDAPAGTAKVSLTFAPAGHVEKSSIAPPYEDTAVGKCVLRAMAAVIVPPFEGDAVTLEWEIELEGGSDEGGDEESE